MDLAAVIISALAMVVAAATGIFAYRQAVAARRQAEAALDQNAITIKQLEIEQQRRVSEKTPRFDSRIDFVGESGHRLLLTLRSTGAVEILSGRFADQAVVDFIDLGDSGDGPATLLGRVLPGKSTFGWVSIRHPYPRTTTLEIGCSGESDDEKWTLLLDVDVFPDLKQQSPDFGVKFEIAYPPPHYLEVELDSRQALASLEVDIVEGSGVSFRDPNDPALRRTLQRWGPLNLGASARWPVEVEPEHSEVIALQLTAVGRRGERWSTTKAVEVPWFLTRGGRPSFEYSIERPDGGSGEEFNLYIQLESPWPLRSLEVEIDSGDVWFDKVRGERSKQSSYTQLIEPKTRVLFRIFSDHMGMFFWLRVRATDTYGEEWLLDQETVDVPARLRTDPREWLKRQQEKLRREGPGNWLPPQR